MADGPTASRLLSHEARALLARLRRVKPFALHSPMVAAAAVSPAARSAIEGYLADGRRRLRSRVQRYLDWLHGPEGARAGPRDAQRRFTALRLRFNAVLTQFDIFDDVMTQRAQHDNGVLLGGLDALAQDALEIPGGYFEAPPVVCYLDRGHGAAIRRARTRLPGGGDNPVAVVRVPRERMVGSSLASSLVHEVGHQGAVLLGLIGSVRRELARVASGRSGSERLAWRLLSLWISEILADLWSLARVGVAATLGLIGVLSLPRLFVFRMALGDPHPFPWIRAKIGCAMGRVFFPHPQWGVLERLWETFYPKRGLAGFGAKIIEALEGALPEFAELLASHRSERLRGQTLAGVLGVAERQPAQLAERYARWLERPRMMRSEPPSLVFAVIGQARADGVLDPRRESDMVEKFLRHWALSGALEESATCAAARRTARSASLKPQIARA